MYIGILLQVAGSTSNAIISLGIVSGLTLILALRYRSSPWRRVPPGPPGVPLLGNTLQLKGEQWLLFSAWRKTYGNYLRAQRFMDGTDLGSGDIFYLDVAGRPMVVINRHDIATELLDRRAGKYTDRPPNIVGWEIMTGGLLFAFGRYNDMYGHSFS